MNFDVAIVGGGPAATTCGTLLRKYRTDIQVGIFEREKFPRDHVGESQLPFISQILNEMGVWNKVEEAGFPVKIGATYRWGNSQDLWDFNFLPDANFKDEPRPSKFEGQRLATAFQVDRAVYDSILLDHARECGCEVHEGCSVREVLRDGDEIKGLVLEDGTSVTASYYLDASGHVGFLRRAMNIGVDEPSSLRNIAIWDYWQNAEWAVNLGIGGTRIQVMSIGYGWLWFIPLSPTRTSIGLVCPADFYKKSGLPYEELYTRALRDEPRINSLTRNGERERKLSTTKDWSFIAQRMAGKNWMLIGESAGFADPILSAGMSLAHSQGREAAFSILEFGKGRDVWLKEQYESANRRKIGQHIRFADYWYSANAHFSELKEFTRVIAADAGLDLDAESAFQWLGSGGFVEPDMAVGGVALFSLDSVYHIARKLSKMPAASVVDGHSLFLLNLRDAELTKVAHYEAGKVHEIPAYRRGNKLLPLIGIFGWLVGGLKTSPSLEIAVKNIASAMSQQGEVYDSTTHSNIVQALDALARDGWVKCKKYAGSTPVSVKFDEDNPLIEKNRENEMPPERIAPSLRS